MIDVLTIERFKSIRRLSIECSKVNVFIGPPDTGKTNILESLYLLSRLGWGLPLDTSLRLRADLGFEALFYRQFFDEPVLIELKLSIGARPMVDLGPDVAVRLRLLGQDRRLEVLLTNSVKSFGGSYQVPFGHSVGIPALQWLTYYTYTDSTVWQYSSRFHRGDEIVHPPHGENLIYIARHNSKVYGFLKDTVAELDWKLRFDQFQKNLRLSEVRQDEIIDYNLDLLSDSLKRLFFYSAVLMTSNEAVLVLDEPDVYAFPPYPKSLAEMIAADASNQFFITTHNPYFLVTLIEKTPAEKIALFVCDRDSDHGTIASRVSKEDLPRVVEEGASVFFNLEDLKHE